MLSEQDNQLLTRIGPGTPMGDVLRRFWQPACLSEQLPEPGSDPVKVRLLGEDLVAFRDQNGKVGVLDEYCCHRTASLLLGRVEDCGIRCIYHGWKFAVDGTILETPNVEDDRVKSRIKQPAYPTKEVGGMVWCYMGPAEKMPELPMMPWMRVPPENRVILRAEMDCNFLQMMEASYDSSHVGVLHQDSIGKRGSTIQLEDDAPRLEIEDTDFGFYYGAIRKTRDPKTSYIRVTPFVMPFYNLTPDSGNPAGLYQPMDDGTAAWHIVHWSETEPQHRDKLEPGYGLAPGHLPPGDYIRHGRFNANKGNRYFQDRSSMRRGDLWSGLDGFLLQDGGMVISMGRVADRTKEHLVPADAAIGR
ncbi:MAG: Rieske 2Fe-2S domain-containing protein, partial [Caulobacteraceae bacterium]|nr:Rieske 2Fe-2S domain-containing protein [Caulobacteraceae bacterium]